MDWSKSLNGGEGGLEPRVPRGHIDCTFGKSEMHTWGLTQAYPTGRNCRFHSPAQLASRVK